MAGIQGLKPHGSIVTNRYYNGGHSCFFTKDTLKDWCEIILGSFINNKDERDEADFQDAVISFLTKTKRRWIVATITTIPLVAVYLII